MKKILILITGFLGFAATAQEFESGDDALFFLDEKFNFSAFKIDGDYWVDPVMIQYEYDDAIYLHTYKGRIKQNEQGDFTEQELAKQLDMKDFKMIIIDWKEIKAVTVAQKNNLWWLTIIGTFKNDDQKIIGNAYTFYIEFAEDAQKIKAAIEFAAAHVGDRE